MLYLASVGQTARGLSRNDWLSSHVAARIEPRAGGLRMLKVLIVEDDLMLADASEEILVGYGYEGSGIARTVADALALARHAKPDLVMLDLRLADGGLGTEVAAQLPQLGRPG